MVGDGVYFFIFYVGLIIFVIIEGRIFVSDVFFCFY